jgi:hypothetical protein
MDAIGSEDGAGRQREGKGGKGREREGKGGKGREREGKGEEGKGRGARGGGHKRSYLKLLCTKQGKAFVY